MASPPRMLYSLGDLKRGLVRVEDLSKSSDGTDGSHALAAGLKARSGGQSGRSGGTWKPQWRWTWQARRYRSPAESTAVATTAVSAAASAKCSPRISSGTSSSIRDRSRNSSTSSTSRSRPHNIQGDRAHRAFVSSLANTDIFCQSAVQYPLRVFLTRTRARKLLHIHILETTPILGARLLHHDSQPPRRRTLMDRPFRPRRPRALSPNRPPWRISHHQASCAYRVQEL